MLVKQMHIQFVLGLQKMGANSRRKFYPQEIDALLNAEQDTFIQNAVRIEDDKQGLGFERIQVDVDKVRPLIMRDIPRVTSLVEATNQWRRYKVDLPGNYSYLLSDRWDIGKLCSTSTQTTIDKNIYVVPFPDTAKSTSPYYQVVTLTGPNFTLPLATLIPSSLYQGLSSKEEKYRVVELVLETFYEFKRRVTTAAAFKDYDLYWEKAGELYHPSSFIFVSTVAGSVSLTIDSGTNTGVNQVDPATSTVPKYVVDSATNYQRYASRLLKVSEVDNVLPMKFYGPLPHSPISVSYQGSLQLYTPTSHIVNKCSLTYIRRAARIDLSLQRSCELAPDFHQTIVDMAVMSALAKLEAEKGLQLAAATKS